MKKRKSCEYIKPTKANKKINNYKNPTPASPTQKKVNTLNKKPFRNNRYVVSNCSQQQKKRKQTWQTKKNKKKKKGKLVQIKLTFIQKEKSIIEKTKQNKTAKTNHNKTKQNKKHM